MNNFFTTLTESVGNRLVNNEQDVRTVKKYFKKIGYLDEDDETIERGIITSPLTDSIKRFQRERGLKEDGLIFPNGETHIALNIKEEESPKKAALKESIYKKIEKYGANEGDRRVFKKDPFNGTFSGVYGLEARQKTEKLFSSKRNTLGDNDADAFRHALWSYKMAKHMGQDKAKEFADGHENTKDNNPASKKMDLYNNQVGRDLAKNPKNLARPDEEVILEVLNKGQLQTRP